MTQTTKTDFDYEKIWEGGWNDATTYGPACRHRRRIVAKLARQVPHKTVCDLGCGDGALIEEMSRSMDSTFFGSDVSQQAIDRAKERVPSATFRTMDLMTEVPDEKFDVVLLSEVLEHIENDADVIARLAPVCRHIVISVPGGPADKVDRRFGHFRNYDGRLMAERLEQNGFEVIKHKRWGFPFREIIQWMSDRNASDDQPISEGPYSTAKKRVANILYLMFFLNILPMGSQVFAVGKSTKFED